MNCWTAYHLKMLLIYIFLVKNNLCLIFIQLLHQVLDTYRCVKHVSYFSVLTDSFLELLWFVIKLRKFSGSRNHVEIVSSDSGLLVFERAVSRGDEFHHVNPLFNMVHLVLIQTLHCIGIVKCFFLNLYFPPRHCLY